MLEAGISARELLERELAEAESGQTRLLARDPDELVAAATREIAAWSEAGLRLLTVLDEDYPSNLRQVHDRPALLFLAGRLTSADRRSIAVIGSRRASATGLGRARELSAHLVATGYTVISGLAAGIDAAAHAAAFAEGGRTLAVIGTGLQHSYPSANRGLQDEIATRGAVLSQFWPETPPSRDTFPLRNAVMSGLALGTVIVEATAQSGARIQARRALAQGRRLFLAEAQLQQAWSRELAERPGVHVFRDSAEITQVLGRLEAGELVA